MNLTDEEISRRLPGIASQVVEIMRRELGDDCLTILLLQPWGEPNGPQLQRGLQYISNGRREFIRGALRTLLDNWDVAAATPPPHQRQ